jgi:trans-2,3-dihydro-3-hydroxyanthranilate isomerase
MRSYPFVTVDVFTNQRFGGNPLAIFTEAEGLSSAQMQALAREMNLSETTFVLAPADPANAAHVRIFTPTSEMPFAGHPMVGTGWWLAQQGRAVYGKLTIEVAAGLVEVSVTAQGATIQAPKALSVGPTFSTDAIAPCLSLDPADILTRATPPVLADVGARFVFVEVTADALARAAPDASAYRRLVETEASLDNALMIHLFARSGPALRTRMFAPLDGILEDPATGSANAALAALLLHLDGGASATFDIVQGVEMGRPSRLEANAWRTVDGVRASVGGGCVPVLRGEAVV